MECFIVENGVERRAGLEDLFPIIGDGYALQRGLSEARAANINLAAAVAFLSDEMKDMVYRNVPSWVAGELKKRASSMKTEYDKDRAQRSKTALIDLIGRCWDVEYPENIIWKAPSDIPFEAEPEEETTEETPLSLSALDELLSPVDSLEERSEEAPPVKDFHDNTVIEVIPQGLSVDYACFCNSYYKLARIILEFNEKARREGLLALEDELEYFAGDLFKQGLRLVVDGTDPEIIRQILTTKLERERDVYRKKLMKAAMEGILHLQIGDPNLLIALTLASLVDINNNALAAACAKYFSGDIDAISNIDFEAAMLPEDEREEIRFIKRAKELSEKARREGLLALEKYLDREGIARRDVFEYGLPLVIDGWETDIIKKILDNLIEHETNPVSKNIAQAKKEALLSIGDGDNPRVLVMKLCAYFDRDIERTMEEWIEN